MADNDRPMYRRDVGHVNSSFTATGDYAQRLDQPDAGLGTMGKKGRTRLSERKPMPSVQGFVIDENLTSRALTAADWTKLAVGAVGGTSIGLGILISPAIPLVAIAAAVGFVTISAFRPTRP